MSDSALRLLLVEDEPPVARTVARRLRRDGHDVTVAGSVAEALAIAGPFDCAVLDIELPDGTGLDVARAILGSSTPVVVFFSGVGDARIRLEASDLGTFVPKSAGIEELVLAMLAAVRETQAELAAGAEDVNGTRGVRCRSGARRRSPF